MSIWAVIPIKRLSEAKSSLGEVLNPEQRQRLVLVMLADVLNAVRQAPSLSGVVMVSPDEKVLDFARMHKAIYVAEPGFELNEALKLAVERVADLGATSVLIIPGDLPLLKSTDIENVVAMATGRRDVVIAPSKAKGTNALLLRPPNIIGLRFGGESFPLHVSEAIKAGVKPRIYRSPTIELDIDTPEDLLGLEILGLGTRTREFLRSLE